MTWPVRICSLVRDEAPWIAFLRMFTLSNAVQQTKAYLDPKTIGSLGTRRRGSPAFSIGDELRSNYDAVLAVAKCQHR